MIKEFLRMSFLPRVARLRNQVAQMGNPFATGSKTPCFQSMVETAAA
jgi:hypothetical protein